MTELDHFVSVKSSSLGQRWKSYEDIAVYLLNLFAIEFGLGYVEGKQLIAGKSGLKWEIDAKGYSESNDAFLVIECKRYTTRKISQETVSTLAYRITDTGASGGIIVSVLGLQKGAEKLAEYENIHIARLNENCTTAEYLLQLLNKIFLGLSDTVSFHESVMITHRDNNGRLINQLKF